MIENLARAAMLFDFYGKLLTKKQQEIFSLYYDQNLSLGEIAEEYKVSRQAVHDILKRGEKILEGYEEKLGLVRKYMAEREKLTLALSLLDNQDTVENNQWEKIREVIKDIIKIQQGD